MVGKVDILSLKYFNYLRLPNTFSPFKLSTWAMNLIFWWNTVYLHVPFGCIFLLGWITLSQSIIFIVITIVWKTFLFFLIFQVSCNSFFFPGEAQGVLALHFFLCQTFFHLMTFLFGFIVFHFSLCTVWFLTFQAWGHWASSPPNTLHASYTNCSSWFDWHLSKGAEESQPDSK